MDYYAITTICDKQVELEFDLDTYSQFSELEHDLLQEAERLLDPLPEDFPEYLDESDVQIRPLPQCDKSARDLRDYFLNGTQLDWDAVEDYQSIATHYDESVIEAYFELYSEIPSTGTLQSAYQGEFSTGGEFAEHLAGECEALHGVPNWIAYHINWEGVWECELRHDYSIEGGYVFRSV